MKELQKMCFHGDHVHKDGFDMNDRLTDELFDISTHCSHFSRRHDFDTFSMSDYQSCENCKNLDSENNCTFK